MMRRREFITLLGAAAAWPLTTRAQQAVPVVGYLSNGSASATDIQAFREGLGDTGYVEGRNLAIEFRWAEGHYQRFPALIADLVRLKVVVLCTFGGVTTRAAMAAALPMPIVFSAGADPVAFGLNVNLNRAGGGLTGVTTVSTELLPKRLELLLQFAPAARTVALLVNPESGNAEAQATAAQAAAHTLGFELNVLQARTESEIDAAFASMIQARVGALAIATDGFFGSRSEQIALLATRHALPTVSTGRVFVAAGGLMSYGQQGWDSIRTVGGYAGRILRGAKPADLPIVRPTKFELVINLKTAKALGLTVPPSLLALAEEVIE